MFDGVSRRSQTSRPEEPGVLYSAGRHMKQPFRRTVSASHDHAERHPVDVVAIWRANPSGPAPIVFEAQEAHSNHNKFSLPNEDILARKMQSIDDRERHHQRKKRNAFVVVVSVISAIPALAIALIFIV